MTTNNASLGMGTRSFYKTKDDGEWIDIDGVISLGALSGSYSTVDQTTLTDSVKRVSKGVFEPPEVELKLARYVGHIAQDTFLQAARDGAEVSLRHIWVDGDAVVYQALLTSVEVSDTSYEEKREVTVKGKGNSRPVWTTMKPENAS